MSSIDSAVQSLDDMTTWTGGVYRRFIELSDVDGVASAAMEDEQHHVILQVHHDRHVISGISGELIRYPWTICPGATSELESLVGLPLDALASRVGKDRVLQCNHLFDLALLLAALIVRQEKARFYRVDIGRDLDRGKMHARLQCNAHHILEWRLVHKEVPGHPMLAENYVVGDSLLEGVAISDIPRRLPGDIDPELYEAIMIMRRAIHVAPLHRSQTSISNRASDYTPPPSCFTYQPQRVDSALYVHNSMRDFTFDPDRQIKVFR